ncbi:MAG: helix-turn-helix transcriptional regulator [Clostridia bacterium]|nr:helix-turn-helix transcriptional regulator [Clostridia bacterium]
MVMENRIRALREDRDMRQIDLAEATGIDQRTISNYETGKSNPDSYALIKLADFFNVSIDYLVGRCDYDFYESDSRKTVISQIQDMLETLKKSF